MKLNTNKIFDYTFLLIILFFCNSCNNEELNSLNIEGNQNKVLSLQEYFEIFNADYSGGELLIESNLPMSLPYNPKYINVSSSLNDLGEKVHFSITNPVSNESLKVKNSNSLGDVFGKKIEYNIGDNNSSKAVGSNEVYIPTALNVQLNTTELRAGTVVTWNVDEANANGLVLWYEYSPFSQDKYDIIDKNRSYINGGLTIPDSGGSYIIKASDIESLPNNSYISFFVSRAGFDVSQNTGGESIALVGVTTVSSDIKVVNNQ